MKKVKEWAKLAKNPKKATSKALDKALTELKHDHAALKVAKDELEEHLKEAYLNAMAGEEVDLKALQTQLFEMQTELGAMVAAQRKLEIAIKEAKTREAQERLDKVKQEIEKVKAQLPSHKEKGLNLLAQALAYLGSFEGFNGQDLTTALQHLSDAAIRLSREYADWYQKVPKPKTHLRARLDELNKERLELEKALKVGSYKPSEPREFVEEPPKITFFGL